MKKLLASASIAALLLAAPAQAQLLVTGVGAGGFGGVAIDTSTGFQGMYEVSVGTPVNSHLGVTNPTAMTHAWWTFVTGGTNYTGPTTWWGNYLFASNANTNCEASAGFAAGLCDTYETVVNVHFRVNYNDATGTPAAHGIEGSGSDPTTTPVNGVWEFRMVTIDPAGNHHATVINDTNVDSSMTWNPFSNITIDLNNNQVANSCGGFFIFAMPNAGCSSLAGSTGWMNDLYINNVYMGCTGVGTPATIAGVGAVTCTAANTIPIEVIRKFRTAAGAPPLHTNTCDDVNGVQALVCHFGSGDQFLTEHGSATFGAFSGNAQNSALTIYGEATPPAPYGPSGLPAGQATLRFVPQLLQGACTALHTPFQDCGATSQMPGSTMGTASVVGDAVLLAVSTSNSTATNPTVSLSCPANLASTQGGTSGTCNIFGPVADTTNHAQFFLVTGFAKDTSGAWPIPYTGTAGARVSTLTLEYTGNLGFDGTASCAAQASNSTWTAPSITTSTNGATLIQFFMADTSSNNRWINNNGTFRWKNFQRSSGGPAFIMATDEVLGAAGTYSGRTATHQGSTGTPAAYTGGVCTAALAHN